jgi:hypothetical protein
MGNCADDHELVPDDQHWRAKHGGDEARALIWLIVTIGLTDEGSDKRTPIRELS